MQPYILENGEPKEATMEEWAAWVGDAYRTVKKTLVTVEGVDVTVSTVFLGLDHNWCNEGPPILWETMIFGGVNDHFQERYSSKEEAVERHGVLAIQVLKGEVIDDSY